MRLRYKELRLVIPSLYQINKSGKKGGSDWCGRTSAAMIYNYYQAARAGGIDSALDQLIINRRPPKSAPFDLVLPDGTLGVNGYFLLATMQRVKPEGWAQVPNAKGELVAPTLHPVDGRGAKPDEARIRSLLAPLLTALEMFNPALFYSGLSSNVGTPRHIVVVSGYRVGPGGALWLHIDDPGSTFHLDAGGQMVGWTTHDNVTAGIEEQVLIQQVPDSHEEVFGRRYWLRASRLFDPNHVSSRPEDLWCDHCDRPGMSVYYNDKVAEPMSACVKASAPGAGLPIDLLDPEGHGPSGMLPVAWDNASAAGAPYPLGSNRAWHNGIHFTHDPAVFKSTTISAVAPGEIVFVRFPARDADTKEDLGAVLVKHAFDPASLRLLDPRRMEASAQDTVWLYSLSMNLLGGDAGASKIMARLDHGSRPKPREFLPAPAPCTVFGYDAQGEPVAIDTPFEVGQEVDARDTFSFKAGGAKYHGVIADAVRTNLEVWEDGQPQVPLAPEGASLGVLDPHSGRLTQLRTIAQGEARRMLAECGDNHAWQYDIRSRATKTWVALTDEPGLQLGAFGHCIHDDSGKAAMAKVPAHHGVAFLRERAVPISVDTGGGKLTGSLSLKAPPGGEPVWCPNGNKQTALKAGASATDVVFPDLVPCVPLGPELKAKVTTEDAPVTYTRTPLCYYNPATGTVLSTTLVANRAAVVLDRNDRLLLGGKYAKLQHYDVEVTIRPGTAACAHAREAIDDMLAMSPKAWPLLTCWADTLPLYTVTAGAGDKRSFPDDSLVELEGKGLRLSLREGPVKTSGKLRAWPDMSLVAGLNPMEFTNKHAELVKAFAGPDGETLGRLMRGESRLFGAQVDRSSPWHVVDGTLAQRDPNRDKTLPLYVEILGAGTRRYFPDKVDNCSHPILAVTPDPDLALRVVTQFRSGTSSRLDRALVEVCVAAPDDAMADNAAEIEAWDDAEAFVGKVRDAVVSGDVADLAALESGESIFDTPSNPFADWRLVGRDPIGLIGSGAGGVHLEMFAGENPLPSDGPIGLWRELRGPKGAQPLSPEFYADVVGKILDDPRLAALARAETDSTGNVAGGRDNVPIPSDQWIKFCRQPRVDRALSRIIAVHPTEWAIDWDEVAKDSPQVRWLKEKTLGPAVGWWPKDIDLPGLQGEDWYFFHPLRLLEWLTTGVDARLELPAGKTAGLQLDLGGELFEMAPSDADEEAEMFRVRTVVGDRAECVEAFIVLEGIDTANPRIPIALERGELLDVWLCEPAVELQHQPRPSTMPSAVPVSFAPELASEGDGTVHLLADTSPHLASCGHSRATYVVEARYNLEMPESVEIELSDPGLSIERVELIGTKALPEGTAFGGTKFGAAMIPLREPPDTVTMARTVAVRIDIVSTGKADVDATLSVKWTGGDLPQATTVETGIATRVIGPDARGQDVAKLQHYLHQILVDGRPCLLTKTHAPASIDGHAGSGTARAIWRFVLHFCASPDWDRAFDSVPASTQAMALKWEAPAAGTIDAAAEEAWKTYGHPDVGPELIAEIVRHYGMPSVLPAVDVTANQPDVDVSLQLLLEAMSTTGMTTLLPVPGHGPASGPVRLSVALVAPVPGDTASVEVTLKLGKDCPFTLVGAATTTLAALMGSGIELSPNGGLSVDAAACTLTVQGPGGTTLGSVRLGGVRDLLAGGSGDKCLDGAYVQSWLADAGFYTGNVDAEFGDNSVTALTAYRDQVSPGADYATLLGLLAAGPSPAAPEETEESEESEGDASP